jgi:hypothetical protein
MKDVEWVEITSKEEFETVQQWQQQHLSLVTWNGVYEGPGKYLSVVWESRIGLVHDLIQQGKVQDWLIGQVIKLLSLSRKALP